MSLFAKQIPVTEMTMAPKRKPQLIETRQKRLLLIIPRSFLLWNTVSAWEKKINLEDLKTREIKASIYKGKKNSINAKAKDKWHEVLGIPGSLCKLEDVMLSEWFPVYMFCILMCQLGHVFTSCSSEPFISFENTLNLSVLAAVHAQRLFAETII